MASVFLYHVVGDLTVGKPELVEFLETETLEAAIRAMSESMEGGIPVWRKPNSPQTSGGIGNSAAETRQQRFVGILNSLDVVAFLAREECLDDQGKAMKTPVSQVVVPNSSLLKEVDPATRLMDALEMMKQGVRRLLVPKSVAWKGMSKRFSILYNGKWLKNVAPTASRPSAPTILGKFCCLSREDVIRFLIGCLGALAPLPLSSISSLGAITPHYTSIEASLPAIKAAQTLLQDPSAIAVVEGLPDGRHRIIGEISTCKLWKCDYLATAWALANLSAGQFVMGVEDTAPPCFNPDIILKNNSSNNSCSNSNINDNGESVVSGVNRSITRPKKFSSRSIGFFSNSSTSSLGRSMYRGRSTLLTCKVSSSLAAVMAQMLSHRATHVWVTEEDENFEDIVVGLVGYADILAAVTRFPAAAASETVPAAPSVLETAAAIPEKTACVPAEAGAT